MSKIAIIGDFNPDLRSHQATNEAIAHSSQWLKAGISHEWVSTEDIDQKFDKIIHHYNAFWIAPGSPYKNMRGVLRLIEFARLNNVPTLGTCGGFQHMIIEFARNVLQIKDAEHAEYNPYASKLIINPLTCSLKGQILEIHLIDRSSKVFTIFGTDKIYEKYYCNFGLNPDYQNAIDQQGFKVVGMDIHQEARLLDLKNHPFFIATLFIPQDRSTQQRPHPLVTAFLRTLL